MSDNTTTQQLPEFGKAGFDVEKFKTVQDDLVNGFIEFLRSETYLKQPAKRGHVFYLINYETAEHVIYRGAYQINIDLERELIRKDQLLLYLVVQLSTQL